MRAKHALWVSAANGQSVRAETPVKREALDSWNIVILAERFGWRPKDIAEIPVDLLNDIMVILGIMNAKERSPSSKNNGSR